MWDRNFQPVSLYSIMEYLLSDIKNIKVSIHHISKYILNKSIDRGKANDFDNLNGISKVVWKFIFAFYDSGWDALHIENKVSFRNKVASKFMPKTNNVLKLKNTKTAKKLALISSLSSYPSKVTKGS